MKDWTQLNTDNGEISMQSCPYQHFGHLALALGLVPHALLVSRQFPPHGNMICTWSQSSLTRNIRPAPGKSWFPVGLYECWEYDYVFFEYSSHSSILFSHNLNSKFVWAWSTHHVPVIYMLFENSMGHPVCHFPHCRAWNNWFCEPYPTKFERMQTNLCYRKFFLLYSKTKFPEGFEGPLRVLGFGLLPSPRFQDDPQQNSAPCLRRLRIGLNLNSTIIALAVPSGTGLIIWGSGFDLNI